MKYLLILLAFTAMLRAQQPVAALNPAPKSIIYTKKKFALPQHFLLRLKNVSPVVEAYAARHFNLGSKGSLVLNRTPLSNAIPGDEAYQLEIKKKRITITSPTNRGLYYGMQTLRQILDNAKNTGELHGMTITDYPDAKYRGVVEGFYGTPWTYEDRLRQLEFYGQHRLNTYIYGPKNDPYHSSPNWRHPYPPAEAEKIRNLTTAASQNMVDFVWAIHPGQDIKWNDDDRRALLEKFQRMYDLGVRSFAVFFDDITGAGTDPNKQAQLLNFLNREFIRKKKDMQPLIMCPTEYNKLWSAPEKGYLKTLGQNLDPDIQIMWTGDTVIGDVTKSSVDWFKAHTDREPFFWWNFPVSDYVRDHLLMGRAYGLDPEVKGRISGVVSNPMERAEASKPAIYSLAQFAWNMKDYDSERSWREGLRLTMPENYKALQMFANHNSDLGPNGHRYRREESVAFQPTAAAFINVLKNNPESADETLVKNEYQNISNAAAQLLASQENPALLNEIRPWVEHFKTLGETGLMTLKLLNAWKSSNQAEFIKAHATGLDLEKRMFNLSLTENQNQYQPGVATGTLVVKPTIEETFQILTEAYNNKFGTKLQTISVYMPHRIFTNIPKLETQRLILKHKNVDISPVLEVFPMLKQHYFGVELEKSTDLKSALVVVEGASIHDFELQLSEDGKAWATAALTAEKNGWKANLAGRKAQYIRLLNSSQSNKMIRLKTFRLSF